MKENYEKIIHGDETRFYMDDAVFTQLKKEYLRFKAEYTEYFPNNFICRIITNFLNYISDTYKSNSALEEFKTETESCMKEKTPKSERAYAGKLTITRDIEKAAEKYDFTKINGFRKSALFNYIIKKFTQLSQPEREKIYLYEEYNCIRAAAENGKMLVIEYSDEKKYEYRPIKIEIDDNSFSLYLVGYSRAENTDNPFKLYPLKLSRIKKCSEKNRDSEVTVQEKTEAEQRLKKFGASYVGYNNSETIKVRLTSFGYSKLYLKIINHQRPLPLSVPKEKTIDGQKFYDLTFACSHRQIRNYFFSFGKEAEILEPQELREKFIDSYRDALYRYGINIKKEPEFND
ncbi:MAG: WYL domain-containing protein [Ruminococcus sp.]|nr:WYL domain-containing protein [Ruminococcus sp.]